MSYDIEYDSVLGCYVWWYDGCGLCLGAETMEQAEAEVQMHVDNGEYPEDAILPEGEEEVEYDPFRDDVEADADVLRMAGFGTDEDYGVWGSEEY